MCVKRLVRSILRVSAVGSLLGLLAPSMAAQENGPVDWRAQFLNLCDIACADVNSPTRKVPFYHDSYAVRGLMVAYDLTSKREYLAAGTTWADRMIGFQEQMTPAGAYYMNYGRKPGDTQGQWYVADSSSIGLGILTIAIRCRDAGDADRYRRYLDSVRSFAGLTMDRYVGPGGGITDGLWAKFDGEWWCSSGIFASLAGLLHAETGEASYRQVSLGAIDWLNRLEIAKAQHISFEEAAPTVLMYVFEAYSTAMCCLEPGSDRERGAAAQWKFALEWMARNQVGGSAAGHWDYQSQWGSKLGGLPFHMYVYARHAGGDATAAAADKELQHLGVLTQPTDNRVLSQLRAFALMSYAEKVEPGAIYRTSRR